MNQPARCLTPEKEKAKYRVTNWTAYDEALVKRGNVTLWFAEEVLVEQWKPAATGKRGAVVQYSDMAIQTILTLKAVFSLTYRSFDVPFSRRFWSFIDADDGVGFTDTRPHQSVAPRKDIKCRDSLSHPR